ncbi:NADH-quinone oxidoreductase subunit H, partial [Alistipes sp. OttesenSCG-928-L06]|nr:NADH-quinone oxidoreductase subunit H [Alistipes sp. OttesenSCG-928-L06]
MIAILFILLAAVGLTGIINRTRARLAGRKGIRFGQHLYNVRLLLRKGSVYSTTAGFIFRLAPLVYLAGILSAALFVPFGGYKALLHFEGDVVVFAYLMALSRFFLVLGALDTGSSFEGMGAAREALYGALVEPALFLIFGTLALLTGYTSFSSMFAALSAGTPEAIIVTLLLAYVIIKLIQIEGGRIPVDDPRTHLELTMIHEVMILDYSGFDLALIHLGSWVKMGALATLAGGVIASTIPYKGMTALVVLVLTAAIGVYIGFVESFKARNRLNKNATYIVTTVSLALFAFLLVYII